MGKPNITKNRMKIGIDILFHESVSLHMSSEGSLGNKALTVVTITLMLTQLMTLIKSCPTKI